MFYAFALISMLGYAVQSALMGRVYRETDTLTASAARGVSLTVSMLPLLLLSGVPPLAELVGLLPVLLFAALAAAMANWSMGIAVRYLALGVANAIGTGASLIFTALIDAFYFGARLQLESWSLIGCIALGNLLLGSIKAHDQGSYISRPLLGLSFSTLFGLFIAFALAGVSQAARSGDPLFVAWAWEGLIGYISVLILVLRSGVGYRPLVSLAPGRFIRIALCSAPTLIGTGCYAMAVMHGPMAVATAITSGQMVGITVIAHFLFGERVTVMQWLLITTVLGSILALTVVRGV